MLQDEVGGLKPGRKLVSSPEYLPVRGLVDRHPAEADYPPVTRVAQAAGTGINPEVGESAGGCFVQLFGSFRLVTAFMMW